MTYALQGARSRELLTFNGKVLTHDNAHELEYLVRNARVVTLPRDVPEEATMSIKHHPGMAGVRWPLRREDFR